MRVESSFCDFKRRGWDIEVLPVPALLPEQMEKTMREQALHSR